MVRALAEPGAGPEVRLGPPSRVLLVLLHRDRCVLGQAPRQCGRLGHEIPPRNHLDRQSGFLRLARVERVAAENEIEAAAHPDRVPEELEAEDGRDPVADLGHPVARVLGRDADVGQKRQLAARAHRPAVHRSDHRHVEHSHLIVERLELPDPFLGFGPAHVLGLGQILTGAERLIAGAGDDDGADALVALDPGQRVGQLTLERAVERVQHSRTIQRDDDDVLRTLPHDAPVHASTSSSRTMTFNKRATLACVTLAGNRQRVQDVDRVDHVQPLPQPTRRGGVRIQDEPLRIVQRP